MHFEDGFLNSLICNRVYPIPGIPKFLIPNLELYALKQQPLYAIINNIDGIKMWYIFRLYPGHPHMSEIIDLF